MMRRRIHLPICLFVCLFAAPLSAARPIGGGLIGAERIGHFGLERAWHAQVRVDPSRGEINGIQLHISATTAQTIYEVTTTAGTKYTFSERNLGIFGEPLGPDGAGRAAAEKVRLLRLMGIKAGIEQKVIPDITLYATTNRGMVHALDAETGKTRWTSPVGRQATPMTPLAISENMLAIVNGQRLYVLNPEDGTIISERSMLHSVAAGPAIANDIVYVPLLNGHLQAYSYQEKATRWPETYRSKGSILAPPTPIGNQILWSTDRGDVTAITAGKAGVRYRLRLTDPIVGGVVYSPPEQMLVVTRRGALYSFDVAKGEMQWRYATGEETGQSAAIVGDAAYIINRSAGMHAVSVATGKQIWSAPFVRRFVAATRKRVYTVTNTRHVAILDAASGQVLYRIAAPDTDRVFTNNQTDRMYLGDHTGLLQCLHEKGALWPTIHVAGEATPVDDTQPAGKPSEAKPTDPFSGKTGKEDDDPFKSGGAAGAAKKAAAAKGDEEDPFK